MTTLRISRGGQLSLPASIRRRWGTTEVIVEDLGESVVLRPMPADPISAARGALAPGRRLSDDVRTEEREGEAQREAERDTQRTTRGRTRRNEATVPARRE